LSHAKEANQYSEKQADESKHGQELYQKAGGTAAAMLLISRPARVLANDSPKKILDTKRIAALRAKGIGWKRIAAEMGVGAGTIYRVALEGSKIREKVI
jgi:DNA invertase Pin-like site-specific DNA recombinase